MTVPKLYPPAIHKLDGSARGSWSGRGEWKIVIHTTETRGMPGYSSGALAPHLTFWPARGTVTQHYPMTRPAESIVSYDDDQVFQFEIICYSNKPVADRVGGLWVGKLTDDHLRPIADCVNWLRSKGVPIQVAWPKTRALSYSQANAPGFRYSVPDFLAWPGLLGHQHTPSPNTHWDPGAFPWERLIALINGGLMPNHPADSFGQFVGDHDIGDVPSWSPWDEYVAAGGTSVKESGTWSFTRSDIAWFWKKFVRRNESRIQALEARDRAFEARLAALEARTSDLETRVDTLESNPGSGVVELQTEMVEVVKAVQIK